MKAVAVYRMLRAGDCTRLQALDLALVSCYDLPVRSAIALAAGVAVACLFAFGLWS